MSQLASFRGPTVQASYNSGTAMPATFAFSTTDTTATILPEDLGTITGTSGDLRFDVQPIITDPWVEVGIEKLQNERNSINVSTYKVWECYHMRDDDNKLVKKVCHDCKCRINSKIKTTPSEVYPGKQTKKNMPKKELKMKKDGKGAAEFRPIEVEYLPITSGNDLGGNSLASGTSYMVTATGTIRFANTNNSIDFDVNGEPVNAYQNPREPLQ